MKIIDKIKNGITYFDGATGTVLHQRRLQLGVLPETWNIDKKDIIVSVHKDYLKSGADIIKTNTFGANCLKFPKTGKYALSKIIKEAIRSAREAIDSLDKKEDKFIAFDIGPLCKMLSPLGDLEFERAVEVFKETFKHVEDVDCILIETMSDSYETKAAVIAAKETLNLPIFVTNVYEDNGKLLTGADVVSMVTLLEGLGVDAIGINCGMGPNNMKSVVKELYEHTSLPIIANPNAGIPSVLGDKTIFDVSKGQFASEMLEIIQNGARVVGGCCGTTPEYIKELISKTKNISPLEITKKTTTYVSSYSKAVKIGDKPIIIGERINPTGKKLLKEALRNNNISYILDEALGQKENGADVLDVNVGMAEIDETKMLEKVIKEIQAVCDLPLQIDTSNIYAMEKAMRVYNGKPLINSVNGKKEIMQDVFKLVKKYGGVVVGLTLDENGISDDPETRVEVAKKIINFAKENNIEKKDLIIDPLALTIGVDENAAKKTLKAISILKNKLKVNTSLGVSNVSFGMPNRDEINAEFFKLALLEGLDCAIINPLSKSMMDTYYTFLTKDKAGGKVDASILNRLYRDCASSDDKKAVDNLYEAIVKGLKDKASSLVKKELEEKEALEIIDTIIIPALNYVGQQFQEKVMFLPQLLMSAEAAKVCFKHINLKISTDDRYKDMTKKASIVLATVKGDIHDIGKNIVKVLLDNYGYDVIDLGKDVDIALICQTVLEKDIKLLGLSALMTTSVKSMEQTIIEVRKIAPNCKIMVGGAVLTKEYAKTIGADFYGKDAMESVKYAEELFNS